jgi:hypothetical protein
MLLSARSIAKKIVAARWLGWTDNPADVSSIIGCIIFPLLISIFYEALGACARMMLYYRMFSRD